MFCRRRGALFDLSYRGKREPADSPSEEDAHKKSGLPFSETYLFFTAFGSRFTGRSFTVDFSTASAPASTRRDRGTPGRRFIAALRSRSIQGKTVHTTSFRVQSCTCSMPTAPQ